MPNKASLKKSDTGLEIAIADNSRKKLAEELAGVLANGYVLYLKTQAVHWNVTGPSFKAVHDMTEAQYTEFALANDDIAERIRALGYYAPASLKELLGLASIKEMAGVPKTVDMLKELVAANETIGAQMSAAVETAEKVGDVVTADLLTARKAAHDKHAWMLRSMAA
jgi:starvation-inducible DNA-binding protein